ncbi:MAG: zinc ribbon-containing protein [Prevotellaceae bacterium]|jgi:rubrerythrin|nr:zinc ribbon-containing protein [Prevotellaceae bacterium]
MYNSGDKPEKGTYQCANCGHKIELKSDSEELPKCPVCGNSKFKKAE